MQIVLCGKCARTFEDDHIVEREDCGFKRDKCQACGRVKWIGRYNVQVKLKNPNRIEPAAAV